MHRGIRFRRTKSHPREAAFQQAWEDENYVGVKYNGSRETDFLQYLFTEGSRNFFNREAYRRTQQITDRDRMIVATVIQWLASNVGFCFLERMLKSAGYEIRKIDKE